MGFNTQGELHRQSLHRDFYQPLPSTYMYIYMCVCSMILYEKMSVPVEALVGSDTVVSRKCSRSNF